MAAGGQKLSALESLRGIAALIVFIDHSINMFAAHLRWTNIEGAAGLVRRIVAWTPLSLFYSGIPAVWIFFLLSGFVLSIKFLSRPDDARPLVNGVLKRYFRLMIPILGAGVVFCSLVGLGCVAGAESLCRFPYGRVLWEAVYTGPFSHDKVINTPLWTISWEIYGSFIVFAMLAFFFVVRSRAAFVIMTLACFFYFKSTNYMLFVIGVILCFAYANGLFDRVQKLRGRWAGALLAISVMVSLYLLSYPFPRDNIAISWQHTLLPSWGTWRETYDVYTKIGAILFFFAFLASPLMQRIIDYKASRFLGFVSFSLYILHYPIMFAVKHTFAIEQLSTGWYIVLLVPLSAALLFVSWLFAAYVDDFSIRASNRFGDKATVTVMNTFERFYKRREVAGM